MVLGDTRAGRSTAPAEKLSFYQAAFQRLMSATGTGTNYVLRHALRSLRRTPRMFACAVVCLAGAIGTATAVFAIVNAVVLRPLPFQHANRLVAIWGVNPARDTVKRGFSWPDTIDLSRATRSLDGVAALANAPAGMTLTGRGEPAQIPMWVVSGNFFEVLGVLPALGRTLQRGARRPAFAAGGHDQSRAVAASVSDRIRRSSDRRSRSTAAPSS